MIDREYNIVEGRYLRDILDQPAAIESTIDGLRSCDLYRRIAAAREQVHSRVVLTGMGSSLHSLYLLEILLTANGETVCRVETSELIHSLPALLTSDAIVVAVSQSGRSAEMVRMLNQNRHASKVIGITNTLDSPLYREADLPILTGCGEEFSVSTKTYVAGLCALDVLGSAWCGLEEDGTFSALLATATDLREYLQSWRDHVYSLALEIEGVRQIFILGRGPSLATCGTGALITKESTRSFAEGMSSAAFRHGPLEMLGSETMAFVCEGDTATSDLNRKLVRDIRERGGRAELLGPGARIPALRLPEVPSCVLPILEIAPVQMLTLAIAARGGFDPGHFTYATKVTAEE